MKPPSREYEPYGMLLALDGYGAPEEACTDPMVLFDVLECLPVEIGMRTIGIPHIIEVDEPGISGFSAFTFIIESHISIHTYKERGFVTVDIYSCKPFSTAFATRYIAEAFDLVSYETRVLTRGRHFNDPSYLDDVRPHPRP